MTTDSDAILAEIALLQSDMDSHDASTDTAHQAFSETLTDIAIAIASGGSTVEARLKALEQSVASLTTITSQLSSMLTLNTDADAALASRVASLEASVTELYERVANLEDGPIPPIDPLPPGDKRKVVLARSGSADDLLAAVTEAGADESIVLIPPGDFNLDKVVVAPDTCSFGPQGGQVRLQKTHRGQEFSGPAFAIFHTGKPTIHEFSTIVLLARSATDQEIGLGYYGAVDGRPHHNEFHNFGRSGVMPLGATGRFSAVRGQPQGVAWGNLYKDGLNSGGFLGYGTEVVGDDRFTGDVVPGSAENMWIMEDEIFDGRRHSIAANNYSMYVVRYSTIRNQLKNASTYDVHGLAAWPAGGRWVEIYENIVESNTPGLSGSNWGIGIRGGGGVAFNNKWKSRVTNGYIAIVVESSGSKPTDAQRAVWTTGSSVMPQVSDPLWTKQFHAWNNFDMNDQLIVPEPKSNSIRLGRDVFTTKPAEYAPLAYPHPWRVGYE